MLQIHRADFPFRTLFPLRVGSFHLVPINDTPCAVVHFSFIFRLGPYVGCGRDVCPRWRVLVDVSRCWRMLTDVRHDTGMHGRPCDAHGMPTGDGCERAVGHGRRATCCYDEEAT
jgi:hypothetical protein